MFSISYLDYILIIYTYTHSNHILLSLLQKNFQVSNNQKPAPYSLTMIVGNN